MLRGAILRPKQGGNTMKMRQLAVAYGTLFLAVSSTYSVYGQDLPQRKEWRRADLSGAPGMEVIVSFSEYSPGESIPLHFHHGIEAAYVIEGGMVQSPGKPAIALQTGAPAMALRDVAHAGFTVVGDRTLKLFTVHIVDKGKPLYDLSNK
jgi:quercetin dioxygenase-like cupin family protein